MDNEQQYQRIIRSVQMHPWAILPAKLVAIRDLISFRAAGHKLTPDEIAERLDVDPTAAANRNGRSQPTGVAVIPIVGTIIHRGNMFAQSSGAASIQHITTQFRAAMKNTNVGSIIFDIDSPGGSVAGVETLAKEIYQARGVKPITAVANDLIASAAYWIGSAADEIVVTPTAQVGSIGVLAIHEDVSEALAAQGVKVNLIHAGKYKTEGNPFEPLNDEARAEIQSMVDMYYDMFVGAVSRQRGVPKSDIRNGFGEGRVVGAKTAVSLGMANRLGTLDDVIEKAQSGSKKRAASSVDFRRRRLRHAARANSVESGD